MILMAVSDVVYQAIIAAIVVLIPAYFAHRAAMRAEEVKSTLEKTTVKTDNKLDGIHEIVNSQRTEMVNEIANLKELLIKQSKEKEITKQQIEALDTKSGTVPPKS